MIKYSCIVLLLLLTACTPQSSPDGRSRIRDQRLELQIDSLKQQQHALLDSIHQINQRLAK